VYIPQGPEGIGFIIGIDMGYAKGVEENRHGIGYFGHLPVTLIRRLQMLNKEKTGQQENQKKHCQDREDSSE
jgi:hypothetical protein